MYFGFRSFVIAAFIATCGLYSIALAFQLQTPRRPSADRFDDLVREDFFAGIHGDNERFQRAMDLCERTLADNPLHAEALVWHGSGLLYKAGLSFKARTADAFELWNRGRAELDRAVELQPNNVAVLIPRGATLLEASKNVEINETRDAMLKTAVADYERVLNLQEQYFDKLSAHARGELLFGLADGLHRLGNYAQSQTYLNRIANDLSGTSYGKRARAWLDRGEPRTAGCQGCH